MTTARTQSGKAMPLVLGIAAVAILAFLLIADPLGLGLLGSSDGTSDGMSSDLLDAEAPDTDATADDAGTNEAVGLAGRYGEGDMGAVRMRLMWVDSRSPLAGQTVKLFNRRGKEVADLPSDAAGVVMFAAVPPSRGYSIEIVGEGFSPVTLQGIAVFPQATKDLGDIVLGKDVVIRGRVIDSQGRPVPGTAVSVNTIVRGLASKGMLVYMAEQAAAIPPPLRAATSDEAGYFTVSALDDGIYSLLARHAGYATEQQNDVIVAKDRGADMLTIVLGDGATATGRVLDPDNKPIVGAQVIAVAGGRGMSMARSMQREMAITDERGMYTIDTLARGSSYRFGVVAKGYPPTYEVSETRIEQDVQRDFTLVKGGNLTGVVTDETTGKPIEGARVAVYVGEMGWGGRAEPGAKASADVRLTDKAGRFTFEAITPGPVSSAVVQKPGYVSASFSRWPPPGNQWPAVEADGTTEVTCQLKRGGVIRGMVKTQDGGTPVAGAEVTLMGQGWAAMGSMWVGTPSATSGDDGSYELVGVNPGKYTLLAMADGFSPPGGEQGVEVEIGEGGGEVTRDFELIRAGIVTGIVTDPDGEPIAGANIRIRQGPTEGGGRGSRWGRNMARQVLTSGATPADRTGEDGTFRLTGVGTDTMWVVYAESDEYISGESKPFKLAAGDVKEIEIEMMAGGSLRGVVVDDQGQRLAGARVQVGRLPDDLLGKKRLNGWEARRALGAEVYRTDEEGRFFAPNLKPGRQLVRASKDGFVTHFKRNITINDGQAYENYTIPLSRGEVLEGTVVGADGRPIRRAAVSVTTDPNPGSDDEEQDGSGEASEDVEPTMWARTDDKGYYKIENIKPGTYNVVVWFASGHKGWMRDNSEAAMHRDVVIPGAPPQDFKLEKAEPQDPANRMGDGNR